MMTLAEKVELFALTVSLLRREGCGLKGVGSKKEDARLAVLLKKKEEEDKEKEALKD